MSGISIPGPKFFRFSANGSSNHQEVRRTAASASWTMSTESKPAQPKETEDLSLPKPLPPPHRLDGQKSFGLQFNRLQPLEKDFVQQNRLEFGQFMAREALLDEEYWTAAWLRAESNWEDRPHERYVENYKRKFAEQEFSAIKRRCRGTNGQKCTCIVMVKKDRGNDKRTVLKSVVGTLDFSIRYLLHGETFPGEKVRAPLFCRISRTGPSRYGYIANLCVAKSARRQGIASNMLNFALASAKSTGFQVVQEATSQLIEEQTYLLSVEI
ncbi:uncharacterized protein LOC116193509 isoform X2 [Punica granatum]|uniref:Uncharacterized protein LOC116193509 isoform X2 n=1 Tax=Punica granatum TaxID=22663 RepID=A0A6P8C8T6_PUNGR|nr:uncharacterized protein LOC116193509 isoform X2 [Punica granatum]